MRTCEVIEVRDVEDAAGTSAQEKPTKRALIAALLSAKSTQARAKSAALCFVPPV